MDEINMHVKIPIRTLVTETNALASEQEDNAAGLQNVSSHVDEVKSVACITTSITLRRILLFHAPPLNI